MLQQQVWVEGLGSWFLWLVSVIRVKTLQEVLLSSAWFSHKI